MKNGIIIILAILLILLGIKQCGTHRTLKEKANAYDLVKKEANELKIKRLKDSSELTEQKSLLFESDKKLTAYIKENYDIKIKLKNVKAFIQTATEIRVDSILVPYAKTDTVIKGEDGYDYLKLPAKYKFVSTDLSQWGKITPRGLLIDTLKIPNTQSLVIQDDSKWFQSYRATVSIHNTNKYITTKSSESHTVRAKPNRGLKLGFIIGIPALTFLIGKSL